MQTEIIIADDAGNREGAARAGVSYGDEARFIQPRMARRDFGTLVLAGLAVVMSGLAASRPATAQSRPLRVVALGDSLTEGYQLPASAAFPAVLEKELKSSGLAVEIANAGVSGDTAAQGLARLDWSVPDGTDAVIVALGANDALRGLDPVGTRRSLDQIVARLKERGIAVMLAGMYAPRNLGAEYIRAFDAIYPELSAKYGVPLYPFFLDGIVGDPRLNLADRIHPNPEGVRIMVSRILPTVRSFLAGVARQG